MISTRQINRNISVDILKFIGILCVILAHVSPPEIVHGLRSFDVCMLVYASGITLKYRKYTLNTYLEYLWHRVKRLIIPSYIFIVIYAVICTLVGTIWNENWLNPISYYIKSFSLIGGGIGYLWIMAVYFLLAIVSPLIGWISEKPNLKKYALYCILALLFLNEIMAISIEHYIKLEIVANLLKVGLIYTMGYAIVEISAKFSGSLKLVNYGALLVVFMLLWWISGFTDLQNYKYPPQALYLLYGILVSAVIYQFSEMYLSPKLKKDEFCHFRRIISWFSVNSLDIYFAHIIVLKICGKDGFNIQNWGTKYIVVVSCSALLVLLMNIVKTRKR